jgi:hypothetical protein
VKVGFSAVIAGSFFFDVIPLLLRGFDVPFFEKMVVDWRRFVGICENSGVSLVLRIPPAIFSIF